MADIYSLTTTEIEAIQALAALYNNGDLLKQTDLTASLLKFNAGYKQTPTFYAATLSGGAVSVERQAQISYTKIDTESSTATDDIVTINDATGTTFVEGDLLICTITTPARVVVFKETGNIKLSNGTFTADTTGAFIALRFDGSNFVEQYRYPIAANDQLTLAYEDVYIAASEINASAPFVSVTGQLSGETQATGTVQVTAAGGASGSISVYSDEGLGNILLGTASYSAPSTPAAVAQDLETDINARTAVHGYTAALLFAGSDTNTITAPVGSGAAANSYTLASVVTGGVTDATVTFAGGVDGSEADDTLAQINGGDIGRFLIIKNASTTKSITIQNLNPDTALPGNISITGTAVITPGNFAIFVNDGTNYIFFDVSGLMSGTTVAKTTVSSTPYTVTDTTTPIQYYWVDTTAIGAAVTFNLAAIASCATVRKIVIKDSTGSAGTWNITIDGSTTETIDESLTATISTNYNALVLTHDDGTNWNIV